MGYEARWTGEVRITPPLTWAEIQGDRTHALKDLKLRLDEQIQDTPTGQIRTITAITITPLNSSPYNGYAIKEELQAVVDAYPSHEFAGSIEANPLDPGGMRWRFLIRDRHVVQQESLLTWIDEGPQ